MLPYIMWGLLVVSGFYLLAFGLFMAVVSSIKGEELPTLWALLIASLGFTCLWFAAFDMFSSTMCAERIVW